MDVICRNSTMSRLCQAAMSFLTLNQPTNLSILANVASITSSTPSTQATSDTSYHPSSSGTLANSLSDAQLRENQDARIEEEPSANRPTAAQVHSLLFEITELSERMKLVQPRSHTIDGFKPRSKEAQTEVAKIVTRYEKTTMKEKPLQGPYAEKLNCFCHRGTSINLLRALIPSIGRPDLKQLASNALTVREQMSIGDERLITCFLELSNVDASKYPEVMQDIFQTPNLDDTRTFLRDDIRGYYMDRLEEMAQQID